METPANWYAALETLRLLGPPRRDPFDLSTLKQKSRTKVMKLRKAQRYKVREGTWQVGRKKQLQRSR